MIIIPIGGHQMIFFFNIFFQLFNDLQVIFFNGAPMVYEIQYL
jgi:hypothetical protein